MTTTTADLTPAISHKRVLRLPTSLRSVLTIAFVVLSVLPVALALTIAITRTSDQASQQVLNQMNSVAEVKRADINSHLIHYQETLGFTLVHQDDRENVTALIANPADGVLSAKIQEDLRAFLSAQNNFSEYFVYDLEGAIVISTDDTQIGKIVYRQPYFNDSLVEPHIQTPYYEVSSDALNMVISQPVYDENNAVVGVLAGRLNLDTLADMMARRAGLGETGETYLVSLENNYFLTPSHFEGYALTRSYHSEGIDSALAGQDGSGVYTNYRDQEVIGAYRWLPELQVGLVAEMEQSEALQASRQATLFSVIIAVIAAAVAAAIGLLLAVRITQPITELTRVTRTFADGKLDTRASIQAANEVGELGQSFNTMAEQLQETLKSLEASVREARLATAMAREANRLKSEFLSTMSHELRTPLNAIIGFTEIMLAGMSGELSENHMLKISRIHLNSKRLLGLISDLLDLAKIEAGRVEVLHDPFSVRELAASIQAQTESLAENKELTFHVSVDPDLPSVMFGDAARIDQVAKNLLSNAFKFTKEGRVDLLFASNGGSTWDIAVSDTGIGIPAHALEYIFDEFRQVDGTSQRAYGGSGLGLAITRNLVRIMGGEVRVTSNLGKGSTFVVTLPLQIAESENIAAGASQ